MQDILQILAKLDWSPLYISIKTGIVATFISFFLGIFAARKVLKASGRVRAVIDGILTLPMVLPPTVAGFFLLLLFSRRRPLGILLYENFSIKVVQTWLGCIVAATVIAFPLMYRNARAAFEQIDPNLVYAGRTLGMSEMRIFWTVVIPTAGPGIASGTILTFARALGEYGATSMLAGNIPGKTATVSQRIAMVIQDGDYLTAGIWTIIGNPDLKPEFSNNYNISVEYHWRNYELLLNGYHNSVRNKIAPGVPYYANITDKTPTLPYVNLATYGINGLEASAKGRWACGMTASIAYAYTDERLPHQKDGQTANNEYIPARKHALNMHADWDHTFNKWYGMNIALDGKFVSGVDNVEYVNYYDISQGTATVSYPAYTLWKLLLSNRIGKATKLKVTLDNIFNYKPKYYYLNAPLTDGFNVMIGVSVNIDKL